jgi:uncharacterized protein (TIGR02265 family)
MSGGEQASDDWMKELTRRRSFVKPEHTMRGFFFKGMLESFRTLGDEALVRRCLEACGQERFVDFFSYSVQLLFPILFTALPTLAEKLGGTEAALRQIGRRASIDFLESAAGKAMLILAQGRPQPLLSSMPTAFRVSMNYGSSRVEWLGPTRGRLSMLGGFMPSPFHEGLVRQMLEAGRAQGIHVVARGEGDLDVVCDFSWD